MIDLLKETSEFRRVAEVLFIKSWAEASAGNMSLRLALPDSLTALAPDPRKIQKSPVDMTDLIGDCFLVTASGSRMREIAAEPAKGLSLIRILDKEHFWTMDGCETLSSEWATHAGLHSLFKESRSGERAVLHCHPLSLIALSHIFNSEKEINDTIFRLQHETRLFVPEMLGLIPYAVTGSKALAKASKEKTEKIPSGFVGQAWRHRLGEKPEPGPGPDRDRGKSGGSLYSVENNGSGTARAERQADCRDPARLSGNEKQTPGRFDIFAGRGGAPRQ